MKVLTATVAAGIALTSSLAAAFADGTVTKAIAPGVVFVQQITPTLSINVITIDPSAPNLRLTTAIAKDSLTAGTGEITNGRETVSAMASRTGALVSVNGDYFGGTGDPLGLGIRNGELYSEPWTRPRAAFGFDSRSKSSTFDVLGFRGQVWWNDTPPIGVNAINRPVSRGDQNDVVVYTQLYGPSAGDRAGCTEIVLTGVDLPLQPNRPCTGTVQQVNLSATSPAMIPDDGIVLATPPGGLPATRFKDVKPGDKVQLAFAVAPLGSLAGALDAARSPTRVATRELTALPHRAAPWGSITTGIGGGPRLLKDAATAIDGSDEGFDDGFVNGPHPRTAVGATADGKIVIVAVEGKPFVSSGVSLPDLAAILKRYGAVNAINLDGGGSTTMAVGGVTVNYPNLGTGERRVADMLALYLDASDKPDAGSFSLDVPDAPVTTGSTTSLVARYKGDALQGDDPRLVWQGPASNGVGYVTQDGVFHAVRTGTGDISLVAGSTKLTASVTVLGQPVTPDTYQMIARLVSVPGDPAKSQVSIRMNLTSGLPGARVPVKITVTGGSADISTVTTDEDGLAKATIIWTASTGSVTVSSGGLTPMTLPYDATKPPLP